MRNTTNSPPRHLSGHRKRRGCFLFNVYSFFLGLGSGIIATIYALSETSPLLTKILMPLALLSGLATATAHIALTCTQKFTPKRRKLARSLVNICGHILTTIITCVATFSFSNAQGLFFLCGIFSASCYFMAAIAFIVNLVRDRVRKQGGGGRGGGRGGENNRAGSQERTSPSLNDAALPPYVNEFVTPIELAMLSCQIPIDFPSSPSVGFSGERTASSQNNNSNSNNNNNNNNSRGVRNWGSSGQSITSPSSGTGGVTGGLNSHGLTVTQLAMLAIPSTVVLPSYEEAASRTNSDLPPKYSEIAGIPEDNRVIESASADIVIGEGETGSGENGDSTNSTQNVTSEGAQNIDHEDAPPQYDDIV
ncbi:homeobox protein 10 [Aplysia californica]|uniref:Homeobox protein 10 n=1 Tax=Aplysia californica TaxID=6500 RepID=A0ABM0K9X9_APLCA|nr:homeobox protein 10 [Aplysia californica]